MRAVTAAGRNSLKALPLGRLKKYVAAYGIRIDRAVEKDDIIDAIVAAKVGFTFCYELTKEDVWCSLVYCYVRAPMDVCLLLTRCKLSAGICIVESNYLYMYRIIIGNTLFLEHLQAGPEAYSPGRDQVRVQIPPRFLRGQPHTYFLVQI